MKYILSTFFSFLAISISAQTIVGEWNGLLKLGASEIRIVFNIEEKDGSYTSTISSPDQGSHNLPTTSTAYSNDTLSIKMDDMNARYWGMWNEKKNFFQGTFRQGHMSSNLVLTKEKLDKKINHRPQEPTEWSYTVEDVKFRNKKDSITLAGSLSIPEQEFEHAVILVAGSGAQNRDADLGPINHRPFLVLSDYFTKKGIAVLRYDERGMDESGGQHFKANTKDLSEDTRAAFRYLKNRSDMKGKKIGIVGHSEGGMIAPMVAVEEPELDFIAMLAGPAIPIRDLMLMQFEAVAKSSSIPTHIRDANSSLLEAAYDYIINTDDSQDTIKVRLHDLFVTSIDTMHKSVKPSFGNPEKFAKKQINALTNDWYSYFIAQNPQETLKKVKCDLLAINGELDTQVNAKENLEALRKILTETGHLDFEIHSIPGQNHLFQTATTGAPMEYAFIDETFNEDTMKLIADWILKR